MACSTSIQSIGFHTQYDKEEIRDWFIKKGRLHLGVCLWLLVIERNDCFPPNIPGYEIILLNGKHTLREVILISYKETGKSNTKYHMTHILKNSTSLNRRILSGHSTEERR
jgi:hypothetical protein